MGGEAAASPTAATAGVAKASWPPFMGLWKSRLPAIVVPVLAGLRSLPKRPYSGSELGSTYPCLEFALLAAIAGTTGYARLPFSVTWWLVLLAAFALETELLLGVAACLSLSVLLGWYGVRLCHPQAVSALWGGTRRYAAPGSGAAGEEPTKHVRICWQAWDVFVHGLPAAVVLYCHGPSASLDGTVSPGTASAAAAAATLPLNVLWLWGLGLSLPRQGGDEKRSSCRKLWPWGMSLAETNRVYRVAPELPGRAWSWIYGSHWVACSLWLACLMVPQEVLFAFAIFILFGFARLPYTNAWWTLFLSSLYGWMYRGGSYPLMEGICACCAVTTAVGFYGTQLLAPYAFRALVNAWVVHPTERLGPLWLSSRLTAFSRTASFTVLTRLGDVFIHVIPTATAACLFRRSVTSGAALAALPTNLLYWVATGSNTLAETNKIYGVVPALPNRVWNFIYGSHWLLCSVALLICLAGDAWTAAMAQASAQ